MRRVELLVSLSELTNIASSEKGFVLSQVVAIKQPKQAGRSVAERKCMKYAGIVNRFEELFASGVTKVASDLANLLDHPFFQIEGKKGREVGEIVQLREQVFHDFSALCAQVNVPVPEMEPDLITAQLPSVEDDVVKKHAKQAAELEKMVRQRLRGNRSPKVNECRALARGFSLLPVLSKHYGSINREGFERAINSILVELGAKPIRPDYDTRVVKGAEKETSPSRAVKVLVVDDSTNALFTTARALVGWGNLEIALYRQTCEVSGWSLTAEQQQAELDRVVAEIIAHGADVVLMDQGLDRLEGHEVINAIKRTSARHVFVANTAGSDESMRSVGAFENCNKGSNLRGMRRALERF